MIDDLRFTFSYSLFTFRFSLNMYRRPKFLEVLLEIRQKMSREADYDVDLFAEKVLTGNFEKNENFYDLSEPKNNGNLKDQI